MSWEAFGDGETGHEDCPTTEQVQESFLTGARAMREMRRRRCRYAQTGIRHGEKIRDRYRGTYRPLATTHHERKPTNTPCALDIQR